MKSKWPHWSVTAIGLAGLAYTIFSYYKPIEQQQTQNSGVISANSGGTAINGNNNIVNPAPPYLVTRGGEGGKPCGPGGVGGSGRYSGGGGATGKITRLPNGAIFCESSAGGGGGGDEGGGDGGSTLTASGGKGARPN